MDEYESPASVAPQPDLPRYDTARLEAFSDAVIAIAMTLLVLTIPDPRPRLGEDLVDALGRDWPAFLGFLLSFLVIGIMWMNHHDLFRDIARWDHTLVALNLLLLMTVSFLPFPTSVLATAIRNQRGLVTATLFYGGTCTASALVFDALWLYAAQGRRLIAPGVSQTRIDSRTRRYLPGPLIYASGLLLALITPWITLAIYLTVALFYLLPVAQ